MEKTPRIIADLNHYNYTMMNRVFDIGCVAPCIRTFQGGGQQTMIMVENRLRTVMFGHYTSTGMQASCESGPVATLVMGHLGIATPKVVLDGDGMTDDKEELREMCENGELTVRKLTSKECWRLMDLDHIQSPNVFDDTPYDRAREVCSESQLYKQAGNSICVGVLESIFEQMLLTEPKEVQTTLC